MPKTKSYKNRLTKVLSRKGIPLIIHALVANISFLCLIARYRFFNKVSLFYTYASGSHWIVLSHEICGRNYAYIQSYEEKC